MDLSNGVRPGQRLKPAFETMKVPPHDPQSHGPWCFSNSGTICCFVRPMGTVRRGRAVPLPRDISRIRRPGRQLCQGMVTGLGLRVRLEQAMTRTLWSYGGWIETSFLPSLTFPSLVFNRYPNVVQTRSNDIATSFSVYHYRPKKDVGRESGTGGRGKLKRRVSNNTFGRDWGRKVLTVSQCFFNGASAPSARGWS